MKKFFLVSFAFLFIFLVHTTSSNANQIFQENLSGTPGQNWNPAFFTLHSGNSVNYNANGIINPDTNDSYYTYPTTTLDSIIKWSVILNGNYGGIISCRDSNDVGSEERVIFDRDGTAGFNWYYNGGGSGSPDVNIGTTGSHDFELDCTGNSMLLKEDGATILSAITNWDNTQPMQMIRLDLFDNTTTLTNYQYCDSNGCSTISPTPTLPPSAISTSPTSENVTIGSPFTVDVKVNGGGTAFNAAQATVAVSSNLSITSIKSPHSNSCNFDFTKNPTTSDPSFAGGIYGTSSTGCTAFTLVLTPTSSGTGTISFTNASIKAYSDNSELSPTEQNGSFTISPAPTPTGTTTQTIDDSVQGIGQNQWNFVGNWSHCASCNETNPSVTFYNASQSWDNASNDYVTIQFTGVQFNLYGATDPRNGIGAVSIDGGAETSVDFYSPTRTGNVLLWTSPILSNSTHTVKLRVTGTHNTSATDNYIVLDRGDILATGTLPNLSVNTYPTDTYNSTLAITGTKDSTIMHVLINGSETGVTYPTNTSWQASLSLSTLGNNTFVIYGQDANDNQTASVSITIDKHTLGDINGDGVVDLIDASLFAVDFGKMSNLTYPLSDMNGDGSVDLTDLSILAKLEQ